MKEIQPGIFRKNSSIYTIAGSGESVYGEKFIEENGEKYREWDASRSKVGAAIQKDIEIELEKSDGVLYLGAASGTTVSHFSDVLTDGFVYAVEYSETVIRDLLDLAENRENIAPILGNARKPEEYEDLVDGKVDIVFQDISQSDQPEIFIRNCEKYLKDDGVGLLAVKAKSISTSEDPEKIFKEVKEKLGEKFRIESEITLEPYEKDHLFLKLKKG
ncbi:MAG: fibrillarin-like pre-rRNA processing protein [Candidatus Nanohaloarchaea archaeon]|jgi:fibrillarin-like pre-rRNA processing protein